ncbi:hypothetical protein DSECCO2_591110 [anaerobic digester metagenome]
MEVNHQDLNQLQVTLKFGLPLPILLPSSFQKFHGAYFPELQGKKIILIFVQQSLTALM